MSVFRCFRPVAGWRATRKAGRARHFDLSRNATTPRLSAIRKLLVLELSGKANAPITVARSTDFMPSVTQDPREPPLLADFVFGEQYFHCPLR
jgi:hypothetical protein